MQPVLKLCGAYSCVSGNVPSSRFHSVVTKHSIKAERRTSRWVILLLFFPATILFKSFWVCFALIWYRPAKTYGTMLYHQHLLLN